MLLILFGAQQRFTGILCFFGNEWFVVGLRLVCWLLFLENIQGIEKGGYL
jgi:hypothetical protein